VPPSSPAEALAERRGQIATGAVEHGVGYHDSGGTRRAFEVTLPEHGLIVVLEPGHRPIRLVLPKEAVGIEYEQAG
jgi:hypothetical protein